jgi:hypothetical protein
MRLLDNASFKKHSIAFFVGFFGMAALYGLDRIAAALWG